ncbi:MAG: RimK/LysX family protein [bacterium]|nr:RimK/LysX family protein [bacterium]
MSERITLSAFENVKFLQAAGNELSKNIEVLAKIDTGAFSGVVHAENIAEKDGILSFDLLGDENLHFETREFIKRRVRNTHGGAKKRYLIKFNILIEGEEFEALLGIDNRAKMRFEMLIGRAFLVKNQILVDTTQNIELDEEWEKYKEK